MSRVRHRAFRTRGSFVAGSALSAGLFVSCASATDDGSLPGAGLANEYGCMACHGTTGEGGVGPTWIGLFGSDVTLDDGRVVTVDREYLERAIVEPAADRSAGATLMMPESAIPLDDVDQIVDYLVSLG